MGIKTSLDKNGNQENVIDWGTGVTVAVNTGVGVKVGVKVGV